MPRIRKLQPGGASRRLNECFKLLLSGASGECLAGELGCCGDSCCSSALVSRALAEYCQHSDAAREAFVAAKGIDALQTALVRGSPSAAVAAARVVGALCACPHGLRCVLRWQSASGGDLLSRLAVVAGASGGVGGTGCGRVEGAGLPPELRTECVDALRAALGALHGPAAGGGLELAGALKVNASDPLGALPGDFLTRVALPPLLSSNAHLRAAAARLIAAAAEERLLPSGGSGGGSAAATLAAALGLADLVSGSADRALGVGSAVSAASERLTEASRAGTRAVPHGTGVGTGAGASGGGSQRPGTPPCGGGLRVLALCELVAALLDSPSGAELLEGIRGPSLVLALALGREAEVGADGGGVGSGVAPGGGGGGDWPDGGSGCEPAAEQEALLDAVLLCVRQGYDKLWTAPDEERQRERRAFAAGAARLATLLLNNTPTTAATASGASAAVGAAAVGDCGRGGSAASIFPVGVLVAVSGAATQSRSISTAAALAAALSYWPQAVLSHEDVRAPLADLLSCLSGAVASALRGRLGAGVPPADGGQQPWTWQPAEAAADADLWGSGWREAAPRAAHFGGSSGGAGCSTLHEAAAASAAAAAIRLYGAAAGRPAPPAAAQAPDAAIAAADAPSRRGEGDGVRCCGAAAAVQCLGYVMVAARDCRTATALLTAPLEALLELSDEPLEVLLATASSVVPSRGGGRDACGSLLPELALAAAGLAERLLRLPTGGMATKLNGASSLKTSTWAWHHAGGRGGRGRGIGSAGQVGDDGEQRSEEQHAALLTALRVWSRLMGRRRLCTCGRARVTAMGLSAGPGNSNVADRVDCEACSVRPLGPLFAVAEAAEGLLAAPTESGGRDVELGSGGGCSKHIGAAPSGAGGAASITTTLDVGFTARLRAGASNVQLEESPPSVEGHWEELLPHEHSAGLRRGAAGGCGGLQGDRSSQLLEFLARALNAALCGYAPGASADDLSCVPGSWYRIRACTGRMFGSAYDPANPRNFRSVKAAVVVTGYSGVEGTQAEMPLDSRDSHHAADLADADNILDDCLGCIAALSWA